MDMPTKIIYHEIEWDADEYDAKDVGLKDEVELDMPDDISKSEFQELLDSHNYDIFVDYLSDTFGWCVLSCKIEFV